MSGRLRITLARLDRFRPESAVDALVSCFCLAALAYAAWALFDWAVRDAVWRGSAADCRVAAGACWAFVRQKWRFFVFGFYPAESLGRPAAALALMAAVTVASAYRRCWRASLPVAWIAALAGAWWLLVGGAGLPSVALSRVGGLPLSLLLAAVSLLAGLPLGLALALGRRSTAWWLRWPSVAWVELFRASPLVAILFMASVMVPFLLPSALTPSALVRAALAYCAVAAAYIAEALRGGMQAVPNTQLEAARMLGLSRLTTLRSVLLPQALRHALPGLVGIAVIFVKETSLITMIGMTDFLGAVRAATRDSAWLGFDVEGLVVAAAVYFALCTVVTRIGSRVERAAARRSRVVRWEADRVAA